tara:strand:+ start:1373 stop:1690 length:318 start_codon:yes stop_codon:yes gene_type:complete
MDVINAKEFNKNPVLDQTVEPNTDLKNILVEYVGEKLNPEDQNVTVEMIIETMASEFPEFVLAVAEENWIRGYQQALDDVELGQSLAKEENDKQEKSCKLCEKSE